MRFAVSRFTGRPGQRRSTNLSDQKGDYQKMRIFNLDLEPSAATRRDWRHVCEAWREFVEDTRQHPVISIICLAIILFFLLTPWVF